MAEEKMFLLCTDDGDAVDVVVANTFEEAHKKTIVNGDRLVLIELKAEIVRKIRGEGNGGRDK